MATESSSLAVRFPAVLYSRVLLLQGLGLLALHAVIYFAVVGVLGSRADGGELSRHLLSVLGGTYLFSVLLCAVHGYFLWLPLKRMIYKARKLRKASLHEVEWQAELQKAPRGEWRELDDALMRIHKSLDRKRGQFQREREELQSIVSSVDNAILAVGNDHRIRYYNSKFAVLFKRKRKEEIGPYHELFDNPNFYQGMEEALSGKGASETHLQLSTTSRLRSFRVLMAPLKSSQSQEIYGAVAIFHDETEARLTESMRIDFVANASHELRTPLTSIQGYLDTMREDLATGRTEELGKFLEILARNVERLRLLVRDLLDISSLESGAEVKKEKIIVAEITEQVLQQLEKVKTSKDLKVSMKIDQPTIFADPSRVAQVLMNLVHNAMKYVPSESSIEVGWSREDGMDVLVVEDDGPGIAPEHRERLFERFYRVDKGRTRESGGTGLGLAIVKHIMLRHGGQVELDTSAQGTRFVCRFPIS